VKSRGKGYVQEKHHYQQRHIWGEKLRRRSHQREDAFGGLESQGSYSLARGGRGFERDGGDSLPITGKRWQGGVLCYYQRKVTGYRCYSVGKTVPLNEGRGEPAAGRKKRGVSGRGAPSSSGRPFALRDRKSLTARRGGIIAGERSVWKRRRSWLLKAHRSTH